MAHDDDLYVAGQPRETNEQIESIPFAPNPLVVVARIDHPLAVERDIPIRALAEESLILREPGSGIRDAVVKCFKEAGWSRGCACSSAATRPSSTPSSVASASRCCRCIRCAGERRRRPGAAGRAGLSDHAPLASGALARARAVAGGADLSGLRHRL
jgi:DNA-binding transcriptional LysR family regulator